MEVEPDELALSQILTKTVEELTDEDITKLIVALRAEREKVLAAENSKARAPKSKLAAAAGKVSAVNLSFEDLGI